MKLFVRLVSVVVLLSVALPVWAGDGVAYPTKKNPAIASSVVKVSNGNFGPAMLMDGRSQTGWCEGVKGDGIGEWVGLYLGEGKLMGGPQNVTIHLSRGLQTSYKTYEENGKPTRLKVELLAGNKVLAKAHATTEHAFADVTLKNVPAAKGPLWVRITLKKVKRGSKWRDSCISEVRANFARANPHNVREFAKRFCHLVNNPSRKDGNPQLDALVKKMRKHFINDFEPDQKPRCEIQGFKVLSEDEFELWATEEGDGATFLRFRRSGPMWRFVRESGFTLWD